MNEEGPGPTYWTNTEVLSHYSSNASPRINGSATAIRFNDLDSGNGTPAPYCNGGSAHANWNYVNGTSGSC